MLVGTELTRAYISIVVKDHADDLGAFPKKATVTLDATLRSAAEAVIQVIEKHLKMPRKDSAKLTTR